jgi:regulatory protein
MPGRRGARSGRGWDAIPPRPARDDSPGDDQPGDSEPGGPAGSNRWGSSSRRASGRRFGSTDAGSGELAGPPGDGDLWAGTDGGADGDGRRAGRSGRGAGRGRQGGRGADGQERKNREAEPPRNEGEVAREICLRQLATRPRTRAELAKALTRREISAEVIAEVLDRYDEVGLIDDAAFARAWVSTRHHGRGLARRALANELRQRGVDAELVGEALEAVDDESEADTARTLVERRLRSVTGSPDAIFRKLVGMLARKGYSAGVAIPAVKDALAARDAEAAEFAEQIDADAMVDESTDTIS